MCSCFKLIQTAKYTLWNLSPVEFKLIFANICWSLFERRNGVENVYGVSLLPPSNPEGSYTSFEPYSVILISHVS